MKALSSAANDTHLLRFKQLVYGGITFIRTLWAKGYVIYLHSMFESVGSYVVVYPPIFYREPHKIRIGRECIIRRGVTLNGRSKEAIGVRLGTGVTIRESSYIDAYDGSVVLDDYCAIGHRCIIGGHGGLYIGKYTLIGGLTYIIPSNHVYSNSHFPYALQGETHSGIRIGSNVWIGAGCTILDGVTIGDNSVIGAGSVVSKSIPADVLAYGVPAIVRRRLSTDRKGLS